MLRVLLVLWWGGTGLGSIFWLNCLGVRCGICYFQRWRRVGDGWLGYVSLTCMCGV
jgi:hypothetical protein